ncbi:hypothetical protein R1sor_022906 [Riccia sorocarpa]|uniref:Uncharacterized protein n=1 Tax=Riccia sorocarpa TaxID=122646 RepID=A0ABD3GL71_9MARC
MASSTWLKDLALSADLMEYESWTVLRLLILSNHGTQERRTNLLRALDSLEENKTSKDDFLEALVRELGYKEAGSLVLELYHTMEIHRQRGATRRISSTAESDGLAQELQRRNGNIGSELPSSSESDTEGKGSELRRNEELPATSESQT